MSKEKEVDVLALGKEIVKRVWIIALCAAILGAAMLVYTVNFVQPQYKAQVTFYVNNNVGNNSGSVSSTDLNVALRLVNSYVKIIVRDVVLDPVIEELNLDMSVGALRSMVSAKVADNTEIFTVEVTTPHPQMSADVANKIAELAPDIISNVISGSRATPFEYAKVPKAATGPDYWVSFATGALIGVALAILGIILHVCFDVYVKTEEDIKNICKAPILGIIPDFSDMKARK